MMLKPTIFALLIQLAMCQLIPISHLQFWGNMTHDLFNVVNNYEKTVTPSEFEAAYKANLNLGKIKGLYGRFESARSKPVKLSDSEARFVYVSGKEQLS